MTETLAVAQPQQSTHGAWTGFVVDEFPLHTKVLASQVDWKDIKARLKMGERILIEDDDVRTGPKADPYDPTKMIPVTGYAEGGLRLGWKRDASWSLPAWRHPGGQKWLRQTTRPLWSDKKAAELVATGNLVLTHQCAGRDEHDCPRWKALAREPRSAAALCAPPPPPAEAPQPIARGPTQEDHDEFQRIRDEERI